MTKHLVTIVNRVNNAAIRRIKNERGDLVYVVPSYTLPDDCVMNGGLYPAQEIANSYASLEGTPAPLGHPMDAEGNFINANSEDGILYYQCGVFNKNVKRVQDEKYGNRVYVEKHIHVPTAMQTERGRRVIDAIDRNEPIHTSTGVMLNRREESGVAANGKEYQWIAENMSYDHDAILLDEDGAATPADGVGMMVNTNLIKQVNREGQTLAVNAVTLDTNQSFNDLRETLQTKIQKRFAQDDEHVWLVDMGDDYAVFENGETAYMVAYMRDGDNVMIDENAQEVKRKTLWERITSGFKSLTGPASGFNSNQEGNDMAMKDMLKKRLGDKYEENMSDEDMLNAYDKMMKGNAADNSTDKGEQGQPETVDIKAVVNKAVADALAANKQAEEAGKRATLTEQLKANGVDMADEDLKTMSINALTALVEKSKPAKPAFGLAGNQHLEVNDNASLDDTLPE